MFPTPAVVTQVLYLLHPAIALSVQAVQYNVPAPVVLLASVHLILAAEQPGIVGQVVHAADPPVELNYPSAQELHTPVVAEVQDTTPVAGQPEKTQEEQV